MPDTTTTPARFAEYIGRQERISGVLYPEAVAGMAAMLGRDPARFSPDGRLPELGHWLYFMRWVEKSELAPDGHPARTGFMPPMPLPRRMFAGSRITFHGPLFIGERVERVETIASIVEKTGSSGPLVFIKIRLDYTGANGLAVTEERDVVYRDHEASSTTPTIQPLLERVDPPAESADTWSRVVEPDPALLFRCSAITWNGHRIHYDRRYAMETEGYPGLVVHGPLQAFLLLDLVRSRYEGVPLAAFTFRSMRSLYDDAPFVCVATRDGDTVALETRNVFGQVAMSATAVLASKR